MIQHDKKKIESITVGHGIDCTVTIRQFPFTNGFLTITEDAVGYKVKQNGKLLGNLEANRPFDIVDDNRSLTILHLRSHGETADYYVGECEEISISDSSQTADIFKTKHRFGKMGQLLL